MLSAQPSRRQWQQPAQIARFCLAVIFFTASVF